MPHPTTKVPLHDDPELRIFGAGMTHKGLVREANEDMILTDPTGILWAVADGMGGHGNGDFASDLVIDHLTSISVFGTPRDRLDSALQSANSALMRTQQKEATGVAGATVVAVLFEADKAHITWAGDSRAYRLRNDQFEQLTHDHSVVQDLIDAGQVQIDDMENHPEAHVVTRAIGGAPSLELDHKTLKLASSDRFLLCSDGLSRCVNDQQMKDLLVEQSVPGETVRALVQAAMVAGAPDNVSAIVVAVEEA